MSRDNPSHSIPSYRLKVNGRNITPTLNGRLISLSLTDNGGNEADQLDITLDDHDGKLAIPPNGATLQLWLADANGHLVDKGTFTADEISHDGAPDTLTIRARSADFRGSLKQKREQGWDQNTLAEILTTLAKRNGLEPLISDEIGPTLIEHIDQTNESDISFLTRLAHQHDALASVKAGHLLLMPRGQSRSISGKPIPTLSLSRQHGDQHSYSLEDRDSLYSGVKARWNDTATAQVQTVAVGDASKAKLLRQVFASAEQATNEAKAEWQRLQRQGAQFTLTLATGNPAIYPETPVKLSGWKPQIDETDWLLTQVVHSLGNGGYTTRLEMETRPAGSA
ncbi:phage late control D family protein [Motiliproteus sp.]|uniref:phage late control D family protein n=1 Tax=Motiliproteus sp. TaxID=1898955 RepID=UPI003BAA74E7